MLRRISMTAPTGSAEELSLLFFRPASLSVPDWVAPDNATLEVTCLNTDDVGSRAKVMESVRRGRLDMVVVAPDTSIFSRAR